MTLPPPVSRDEPQAARFVHLDGLRGLAALNVAVSHAVVAFDFALYTGLAADSPRGGGWDVAVSRLPFLLPVAGANFSVCVFLVLSGFVLAHAFSHTRLGMAALTVKRAVRLGVPILSATLFGWAIAAAGLAFNHPVAAISHSRWLDSALTHVPSLPDALREGTFTALIGPWTASLSYDGALWTMPIEFAGSLALIGLVTASRRTLRHRWRPAACVILALGGVLGHPLYVSLMLWGAAVYMAEPRRRLAAVSRPPALLGALLVLALALGTVPFSAVRGPWWTWLVEVAPAGLPIVRPTGSGFVVMGQAEILHGIGALLLLVVVELWPACRGVLGRPVPQFLGAISFPLYLVHMPLLLSVACGSFLLARGAGLPAPLAVALAISLFIAVAIAVAAIAARSVEPAAIRLAARAGRGVQGWLDQAASMTPPLTRGADP